MNNPSYCQPPSLYYEALAPEPVQPAIPTRRPCKPTASRRRGWRHQRASAAVGRSRVPLRYSRSASPR